MVACIVRENDKYAADSVLAVAVTGVCFDSSSKQKKKEEEKTLLY